MINTTHAICKIYKHESIEQLQKEMGDGGSVAEGVVQRFQNKYKSADARYIARGVFNFAYICIQKRHTGASL